MAWLPMYLLDKDVELLNDWLNQEEEIAFLISNGPKKWIAKKQHNIIPDIGTQTVGGVFDFTMPNFIEYNLWHVPSGTLPLIEAINGGVRLKFKREAWDDGKIADPWLGWTEQRTGANARVPFFGAGHPGIIALQINLPFEKEITISTFSWIGNHYKIIGNGADPLTERFWNKLRKMAKKIGKQIPRSNSSNGKNEIFAFPTAYEEIKNGRPCALNL